MHKLLIANRGEIAIRIARSAAEIGLPSVAIYPEDDRNSLHVTKTDGRALLPGTGARAYLDIDEVINVALANDVDGVHPGYGFLSENTEFASRCEDNQIQFIGPTPEQLALFGDKAQARQMARDCDIPVVPGTGDDTSLEQATAFYGDLADGQSMVIKAIAGGGGRGMRIVESAEQVPKLYERCRSEAQMAFGSDKVYVELLIERARHIEVQIIGDGQGGVTHLWDRECSVQRQNQKIVEVAPSPSIPTSTRDALIEAAITMATRARYQSLGTFEFLVDMTNAEKFYFIEANPRLQVEHTVTEAITGVDLVQTQFAIASGRSIEDLGLSSAPAPRGFAIQCRINMESLSKKGTFKPSGGKIEVFEPPSGPGVRVDSYGYAGYETSTRYDSLLAKLIVHSPANDFAQVVKKTYRALGEFRLSGFGVNIPFLQNLLSRDEFTDGGIYTRFVDHHLKELAQATDHPQLFHATDASPKSGLAGARLTSDDPLAVLDHGRAASSPGDADAPAAAAGPAGSVPVPAPLQGTIVELLVAEGESVFAGQDLLVMDAMKMEHVIRAPVSGSILQIKVDVGDAVMENHGLIFIEQGEVEQADADRETQVDPDYIRPDLREVVDRRDTTLDAGRPAAVARRRKTGQRTARENVQDLCDDGTFVEWGQMVLAAQRRRRSIDELIEKSPADGLITGVGSINGDLFATPDNRCAVMSYDYTVFAGTQGGQNHRKTDRIIGVAEDGHMPMVLFAEGGGGRPGDTDGVGGATGVTFARFARLSGLVPVVGITSGRCFAGNASLLGCCDVIIATENANIGMGGPAMIEGGGLGIFTPEEIGPMSVQVPNGVVDILVEDEAHAVAVAKQYLAYFQGTVADWVAPDQRYMRQIIPENRVRVYDVRKVIDTLADEDSVLELREKFGVGAITCLIRVEGRPLGVIANNPSHLGGAIDADGSDKSARFMQLCDAFDIPLLYLCDTPGIMVGPEIEKTALVRHSSRMFLTGANLSVPFFTIVLRKAYGLGAIAMAGGSYKAPYFAISWPTGEFGGMGLEGSVKLGYRDDLAAIDDPKERLARYEEMVARAYENGKALNYASLFSVDDTIDPADSRYWVAGLMKSVRPRGPREGKKRPTIDAW